MHRKTFIKGAPAAVFPRFDRRRRPEKCRGRGKPRGLTGMPAMEEIEEMTT
jgi:hypothetical protein